MFSLYLTPAALGYLTQMILSTLISGYLIVLVYRQPSPQPAHLRYLIAFFLVLTTFITTLFLEVALLPTPRLYAVFVQVPLLAITWIFLIQFAYHFPTLPATLRREARWSFFVAGLYALWESGFAIYRFIQLRSGIVEFRIDWTDVLLPLSLLWPVVIFIRQMYRLVPKTGRFWTWLTAPWLRPSTREIRALRAFALIFLLVCGLSLLNLLRTFYLLSVALANMGISVGILIALFAFALAYLNQRTETTSFMAKLAGITLTTMLAILGIVGWAVSPAYNADYQPDFSAGRGLRFTPNAGGGYDITAMPFDWESNLGRDLQLDDGRKHFGCSEAFDFPFAFYGQNYHAIYVCNDGAISLGRPIRYREYQYRYAVDAAGNQSDPATLIFTVEAALQAEDDTYTVPEGVPSTLDVLENDSFTSGNPITITQVSAPTHGVATTNGATIVYTPTAGYLGQDTFTYTISDGEVEDSAQVTVTVLPVADLAVAQTVRGTMAGLEITLVARNLGPRPAHGAVISDTFPPSLGNITWTCVAASGAACPNASGAGHIEETLATFPADGVVTYTVSAQILVSISKYNTVTITPPAGTLDLNMANNSATRPTLYRLIFPIVFKDYTP